MSLFRRNNQVQDEGMRLESKRTRVLPAATLPGDADGDGQVSAAEETYAEKRWFLQRSRQKADEILLKYYRKGDEMTTMYREIDENVMHEEVECELDGVSQTVKVVPVRVRVHVIGLQNVETVKQSFDVKLWVQLKWYLEDDKDPLGELKVALKAAEDKLAALTKDWREKLTKSEGAAEEKKLVDDQKKQVEGINQAILGVKEGMWRPFLMWQNAMDTESEFRNNLNDAPRLRTIVEEDPNASGDKKKRVAVVLTGNLWGRFSDYFELGGFPWDTQRMFITAAMWNSPQAVVWDDKLGNRGRVMFGQTTLPKEQQQQKQQAEAPAAPAAQMSSGKVVQFVEGPACAVYEDAFTQKDAWTEPGHVSIQQGLMSELYNDYGVQYTALRFEIKIHRMWWFYVWQVIVPSFLLASLAAVSTIVVASLDTRLSVSLSVLLTLVALKFSVSAYLPPTSYLTLLDKYVVLSFATTMATCLQNIVVKSFDPKGALGEAPMWEQLDEPHARADFWSSIAIIILWLLFNVYYLAGAVVYFKLQAEGTLEKELERKQSGETLRAKLRRWGLQALLLQGSLKPADSDKVFFDVPDWRQTEQQAEWEYLKEAARGHWAAAGTASSSAAAAIPQT